MDECKHRWLQYNGYEYYADETLYEEQQAVAVRFAD